MSNPGIIEPLVSISWLLENLDHPNLIILDSSLDKPKSKQPTTEFSNIRIKNARFFDLKNSFSDSKSELPQMLPSPSNFSIEAQKLGINSNSIIVVYDNLGVYSSPRVWWMFQAMGHKNIAILNGGLPAWKKAMLDCETTTSIPITKGDFKAKYQPQLLSNSEQVSKSIDDTNTLTVDARSSGRFTGKIPEPRKGLRSGHIPNSINLPFEKVLKEGKMRSKKELKAIFDDLKIKEEKLIFSCGSGVTACILALAADIVGLKNISVYDGSWSEWGKFSNLPIKS